MRIASDTGYRRPRHRSADARSPELPELLLITLMCFAAPTSAGTPVPDPRMVVTDGYVSAIATRDNTVYIGGAFNCVGPRTGSFVGLDPTSGAPQVGWPEVNGAVHCAAPDGSGGWYIGGNFTSVGGVPRARLAHLRVDMSLDAWNPGADTTVFAIAPAGSVVYVGGDFRNAGGQARTCLAAINATTGQATAWNPNSTGFIRAIAVSGPRVYVGGFFSQIGGDYRDKVAALDATTGLATNWTANINDLLGIAYSLTVVGSRVYVGGLFTSIKGQPRGGIAAVDAVTGQLEPWNPNFSHPACCSAVYAVATSGSTVYVGGYFSQAGGQARNNIAAVDAVTGQVTAWNPNAVGDVYALAASGSTVYAAGSFATIGGQTRRRLAALDAATGLATSWTSHANAEAYTLALDGSTVIAGGQFGSAGMLVRNYLAALDATTGQATEWNPDPNAWVGTLVVSGSTVYAAGSFGTIGGQARGNLAALDAITGQATPWNPNANGWVSDLVVSGLKVYVSGGFTFVGGQARNRLAALNATTGAATAWNPNANNYVYALVASPSTVYAAGAFTAVGGQPRNWIAALDTATGQPTAWNAGAVGGEVVALAQAGSTVYAGGGFTDMGGQPRFCLAAIDASTGLATPWDPGVTGVPVSAIAPSDETVFAGGAFSQIGGAARDHVAALDAASGQATSWNPGTDGSVGTIATFGPTVYVGGEFTRVGGRPSLGFAAIVEDADAPVVDALGPVGGSGLAVGTTRQLAWSASDDRAVESVDLYLSRSGPGGPWELLAAAARNTGSYAWQVTGPAVPGYSAYLRVDARDYAGAMASDIADQGFAISSTVDVFGSKAGGALELFTPEPNPVRFTGRVTFVLPERARARLSVSDVQGRMVEVLAQGVREEGVQHVEWETGRMPAGIYFLRLETPSATVTRRFVVVR